MIFLRTQFNHSFDRKFVFTALRKRFTFVHLFYSHLTCNIKPFPFRSIPSNHSPSTKRRFVGSACTAPTEDLPPSYLQHWSTSLFDSINCLGFHSGHTIASNEGAISGCTKYAVLIACYLLAFHFLFTIVVDFFTYFKGCLQLSVERSYEYDSVL